MYLLCAAFRYDGVTSLAGNLHIHPSEEGGSGGTGHTAAAADPTAYFVRILTRI